MCPQKIISGLFFLLLFSCGRMTEPSGSGEYSVTFCLSQPRTKVTGVTDAHEKNIVRWAVFVFDLGGGLCRYGSSSDAEPITLPLIAGKNYQCIALVNYPLSGPGAMLHPESVTSPDELINKTAFLKDNAPDRLLMYGEARLIPSGGNQSKVIPVRRLVSRVDIDGVSVDFSACEAWTGKTFVLKHIYITNAYMINYYGMDSHFANSSRSYWYNSLGWHGEGPEVSPSMDLLLGDRDILVPLDATHPSLSTSRSFYFYPNPVEDDFRLTGEWRPRHTRLVIEGAVDSDTYYYPIDIPAMGRNTICTASEVVIHGPGWPHPEGGSLTDGILEIDWDGAEAILLD